MQCERCFEDLLLASIANFHRNLQVISPWHLVARNVVENSKRLDPGAITTGQKLPISVHLRVFGVVDIEVEAFHWCAYPDNFDVKFMAAAMVPSYWIKATKSSCQPVEATRLHVGAACNLVLSWTLEHLDLTLGTLNA